MVINTNFLTLSWKGKMPLKPGMNDVHIVQKCFHEQLTAEANINEIHKIHAKDLRNIKDPSSALMFFFTNPSKLKIKVYTFENHLLLGEDYASKYVYERSQAKPTRFEIIVTALAPFFADRELFENNNNPRLYATLGIPNEKGSVINMMGMLRDPNADLEQFEAFVAIEYVDF